MMTMTRKPDYFPRKVSPMSEFFLRKVSPQVRMFSGTNLPLPSQFGLDNIMDQSKALLSCRALTAQHPTAELQTRSTIFFSFPPLFSHG